MFRGISKVFDMGLLGIVWIVFSLPVITMGASFTALYYTTVKVLRRERGHMYGEFWRCFKGNFKDATFLWLGFLLFGAVLVFNFSVMQESEGTIYPWLAGLYLVLLLSLVVVACYVFPVLSRFDMKKSRILRFSVYAAIRHLPYTVVMVGIVLSGVVGFGLALLTIEAMLSVFFIPALGTWLFSLFMERIFKKYMPEEKKVTRDGEVIKEWYME